MHQPRSRRLWGGAAVLAALAALGLASALALGGSAGPDGGEATTTVQASSSSGAAAPVAIPAGFDRDADLSRARVVLEHEAGTFIVAPPRNAVDAVCAIVLAPDTGSPLGGTSLGCHARADIEGRGLTLVGRPDARGAWAGIALVGSGVSGIRVDGAAVEVTDGVLVLGGRPEGGLITAEGPDGALQRGIPTPADLARMEAVARMATPR